MPKNFMDDDFILENDVACELYHNYAKGQPIYDYHCHLPAEEIAENNNYQNLTHIWLYGDHYKWRAMRTNGIDEKFCTGDASDKEKFMAWAKTVPKTLRNPLYHWTHLELRRYFGITDLLSPQTAESIYERCGDMLKSPEFTPVGLLNKMKVAAVCTTDDPADTLEFHKKISQKKDSIKSRVYPTFRPDKAMSAEDSKVYNSYLNKLAKSADCEINFLTDLVDVLDKKHEFFHSMGCRLSDHGISNAYATAYTEVEVGIIFNKVRGGCELDEEENLKLKSYMMIQFGQMNHKRGWTMQLHLGAMRNNNTRMLKNLGPDTGFDSIGDYSIAEPLSRFLDNLDSTNQLPKTILYNLNPRDNEVMGTMIGNFQDGSVAGKMQFGSGWWFLDQKDGMEKQMNTLSSLGLLAHFVGMLTDSRSFLSFPRHEYFRRILCNLIGKDVVSGQIPDDREMLGEMVKDICFRNANKFFGQELHKDFHC